MNYSMERDLASFVVFDFETTGIGKSEKITEIGAVRYEQREKVGEFSRLVNPGKPISPFVQQLTGITDEMVAGEPGIETLLPLFLDFAGELPLIAHNAPFDCGFLFREAGALGIEIKNPVVDTLRLARKVFPGLECYKLGFLTDYFCIAHESAHRACSDADATAKLYLMMRTPLDNRKSL